MFGGDCSAKRYPRAPKTKLCIARAAAKAVSLEERVFMCVSQVVVIVDGGILGAILQVFTRYSANNPQFPVNDRSLFTGVPATGTPADGEYALPMMVRSMLAQKRRMKKEQE
jgi:hypothetical protein